MPNETFLGNRGNQLSLTGKNRAPCEAARTARKGTVLGIEQPFIRAEGAMKPKRVVEAGRLYFALKHGATMGDEG